MGSNCMHESKPLPTATSDPFMLNETDDGLVVWRMDIEHFDSLKDDETKRVTFQASGCDWKVDVLRRRDDGFFSIYLAPLTSVNQELAVSACFFVRTGLGERRIIGSKFSKLFTPSASLGMGFTQDQVKAALGGSLGAAGLTDAKGRLRLETEIEVKKSSSAASAADKHNNVHSGSTMLGLELQKAREANLLIDVTLIALNKQEFGAHRIVLVARSEVFARMLGPNSAFSEAKEGVLRLEQYAPQTVQSLINYMYGAESVLTEPPSWHLSMDLFKLAKQFQLDDLARVCLPSIVRQLDHDNVLSTIREAELHKACEASKRLKNQALKWAEQHFQGVIHNVLQLDDERKAAAPEPAPLIS